MANPNDLKKIILGMRNDQISKKFIEDNFEGSLPGFITAFTSGRKLTRKEIVELQRIIDESR